MKNNELGLNNENNLPKLRVAGSTPVSRSEKRVSYRRHPLFFDVIWPHQASAGRAGSAAKETFSGL